MRYVDAVRGAILAFFIFLLIGIFLPSPIPLPGAELVLTVSTFLFAILAGFYIARLNGRYDTMRSFIAMEDAMFLALFKTSQVYGGKFTERVRDLIDRYYIISYDFTLSNIAYKHSAVPFLKLWDELIKMKKYRNESTYQSLLSLMTEIERVRNTSSTVANERMHLGQWAVLVLLALVVLFSIFFIDIDPLFFRVITVILATVLVLILLILRDLQNFMLGGAFFAEESGQEVLEFIGKPRYYQAVFVRKGMSQIPPHVTRYRLGTHAPGSKKIKIQLIKLKPE